MLVYFLFLLSSTDCVVWAVDEIYVDDRLAVACFVLLFINIIALEFYF